MIDNRRMHAARHRQRTRGQLAGEGKKGRRGVRRQQSRSRRWAADRFIGVGNVQPAGREGPQNHSVRPC